MVIESFDHALYMSKLSKLLIYKIFLSFTNKFIIAILMIEMSSINKKKLTFFFTIYT